VWFTASGEDYTSVNGEVVFAIGETNKQIMVPILVNEPVGEPDESFKVELSTDCCAEVTTGIATVTIKECGPGESKCNCFFKINKSKYACIYLPELLIVMDKIATT